MDLSFYSASSSVRITTIVSHCNTLHVQKRAIKPSYKLTNLLRSTGSSSSVRLFYNRNCASPVPSSHSRRFGIWASTQIGAAGSDPVQSKIFEFKDALWRFLRPHTIRGTTLGSIALVARALVENSNLIRWSLLFKAFCGLVALICGNGYIVGINQIYDIGIDKVNKPYLPIAAGDLSVQSAWLLVLCFAASGLLIVGLNFGPFITSFYCLGLFLGTIYSIPPFRLKRFPVAAFLIIATVRGFLLNFGVYYATRAALGLTFQWSAAVAFITGFVTLFALVIAITKDLPDVEGDRKFKISTFATKLGVRNIAFLGSGLLLANYLGAILAAVYMPQAFKRNVMIPAHTILALGLLFQAWLLEQANYTKDAISGFYRFIWNLFYADMGSAASDTELDPCRVAYPFSFCHPTLHCHMAHGLQTTEGVVKGGVRGVEPMTLLGTCTLLAGCQPTVLVVVFKVIHFTATIVMPNLHAKSMAVSVLL